MPMQETPIRPAGGAAVYISCVRVCVSVWGGTTLMRSYLQAVSNECARRWIVEENQRRQEKTQTDDVHSTPTSPEKPGIKARAPCMGYIFLQKHLANINTATTIHAATCSTLRDVSDVPVLRHVCTFVDSPVSPYVLTPTATT